jgi:hypothetical protein
VDVVWYSAAPTYIGDPNNATAGSHWDVFFSQSTNALASTATFSSPTDVAVAKTGQICTKGTGCTANRELLDFFSITHDVGGDALISYANVPTPGTAHVMFTRQTAGTLIN